MRHDEQAAHPGRSALCPALSRDDDAVVPYQITDFAGGVAIVTGLIAGAALLGWLAARFFLRATRPADAHEGRH